MTLLTERSTVLPLVLALVLAWSQVSGAGERIPLSISVGDWPPYFHEDGDGHGIGARLVRDVFAAEGYEVTFHFLPWKRAYYEAADGKHDATAIWMHTPEREAEFIYSAPVLQERFVLFHRKSSAIDWQEVADLAGLRLGGSIGYSYGPEFDRAIDDHTLTMEWVASPELNFRRLLHGRIDAFPEEINVGYHILRREIERDERQDITYHPTPVLEGESFLLFPRSNPDSRRLARIFNRGLAAFRESGRFGKYFRTQDQAASLMECCSGPGN